MEVDGPRLGLHVFVAQAVATLFCSRRLSVWAHELSHLGSALLLGYGVAEVDLSSPRPSVSLIGTPTKAHAALIHHTGWVASVLLAVLLMSLAWRSAVEHDASGDDGELTALAALVAVACVWTAGEAVQSDLLSSERLISGDEYLFIRDAYLQRRSYLINDGHVEEDPFLDEDF